MLLIMDMARLATLSAAQLLDLGTCITVKGWMHVAIRSCWPASHLWIPWALILLPHEVRYGVGRISRYNVWGAWAMPQSSCQLDCVRQFPQCRY